jgi:hypothetical protein
LALIELVGSAPDEASTDDCLTGVVLPDEHRLLVDLGASPRPPSSPCEVVASFFTPDALYRLAAKIVTIDDGLVELEVHATERVQRRSTVRHRVAVPVSLAAFDGPGEFRTVVGETIDVGPGGCRVTTRSPFPAGVDPTVSIRVPGGEPVVALARILQSEVAPDHCEYRLVFADLAPADAKRLSQLTAA